MKKIFFNSQIDHIDKLQTERYSSKKNKWHCHIFVFHDEYTEEYAISPEKKVALLDFLGFLSSFFNEHIDKNSYEMYYKIYIDMS